MRREPVLSTALAAAIAALAVFAVPASAGPGLGKVDFPVSCSAPAQEAFTTGVLYLHNFEYEDAREAFVAAREEDPGCAMAVWGEAMTRNHPIWHEVELEAGREALARLGETREARLAAAGGERERAWLAAVEILFAEGGTKEERDREYLAAMRRLAERYPEDHEAAAFHALAVLGSAHEGRDFATYMRAAAIAEEVFAANPEHPGAAHYMIHSYDDPIHAPLGLRPARVYSKIAPDAAHAQHMTSHIFVALGMWDEVVEANRRARDVQDAGRAERGRGPNVCGHNAAWLQYGLLQQGRYAAARELLAACHERIAAAGTERGEQWYFGRMRARQVLDSGAREAAVLAMDGDLGDSPVARHNHRFLSALVAFERGERGRLDELVAEMASIREGEDADEGENLAIEGLEVAALVALAEEDAELAVALLTEAAERERAMPFMFGPPPVVQPAPELLGQVLLSLGRPDEAAGAFEQALERAPRRTNSLLGLARAAAAAGDAERAGEIHATLRQIWHAADRLPDEVRAAEAASR